MAIATAAELRPRAAAAGFAAFDAGIGIGAAFQQLARLFPDQEYTRLEPGEIVGWYLPHLFGEVLAPAMLADLEPLVRTLAAAMSSCTTPGSSPARSPRRALALPVSVTPSDSATT